MKEIEFHELIEKSIPKIGLFIHGEIKKIDDEYNFTVHEFINFNKHKEQINQVEKTQS